MKKTVFALIDCNNFFVSCEKIFRPDLEGKPVVVLSSNDGCVVSRSNEAKALGIVMAGPAFKHREVFKKHRVVQFSANFDLYGDISRRITQLLVTITPRIEVYSVDESFLDLSELPIKDFTEWGREVRALILKWVGVPVSIGIAPTKTLAKIGTEYGKLNPATGGAVALMDKTTAADILATVPIEDVWGVGRKLAPRLRAAGLLTAKQLADLPVKTARQLFGNVHGEQLVMELSGISCFPLEREEPVRQSIARTRTFGEDISDINVIESAIASFSARAAFRLRREKLLAKKAGLFLMTNRHLPGYKSYGGDVRFDVPTADTGLISRKLIEKLAKIYDKRAKYHRAGVILYDFVPAHAVQTDLMGSLNPRRFNKSLSRLSAIDKLNLRYGDSTIRYAAEKLGDKWQPKHNLRSPRYTSDWNELPVVKIA